tara:strand:+ start:664 stop:1212 length:549 start_codon:yes stop_codon:yes gene_type:complete
MRDWIALFSHTGTEIANVANRLKIMPRRSITNNTPGDPEGKVTSRVPHIMYVRGTPTEDEYNSFLTPEALVTMHGWMRIVPESICNEYEIYNLHPGLITKYPDLKGKDPQEKVFKMNNPPEHVGCVIHKAVGEVDSGEIYMERSTRNVFPSCDRLTEYLHDMASDMWVDFLTHKLCDPPVYG